MTANPYKPVGDRYDADEKVEWDCGDLPDLTPDSGPETVFDERDPSRAVKTPAPSPFGPKVRDNREGT